MPISPDHLAKARAADSERRRSRALKALARLAADGEEISVSAVARAAEPPPGTTAGTQVSRQSLLADVADLTARNSRLSAHNARLERCLSEALRKAAWEASGLGAPADVETLTRRVTEPEQQILGLRADLAERDEDLAAARAANRELMAQVDR
ncbi:hypothetical protein [Streptomyces sp. NPDC055186]